jgi:hypothetical protein
MLVITSLTETMAGYYYCSASYANSEMLENKVKVETYGANESDDACRENCLIMFYFQLNYLGQMRLKSKVLLLEMIML